MQDTGKYIDSPQEVLGPKEALSWYESSQI
jgi:hypothetical protein